MFSKTKVEGIITLSKLIEEYADLNMTCSKLKATAEDFDKANEKSKEIFVIIKELLDDKDRLDWISKQHLVEFYVDAGGSFVVYQSDVLQSEGNTLRNAIDNAMGKKL